MVLHILFAAGFLSVVVGVWFGVYYWLNPRLEAPDGKARVTGSCGDTMEIRLRFQGNKVSESTHWTNGCVYSLNCVFAAAQHAEGKTPAELLDIEPETIGHSIGGLPQDHMHCATLAAATLREAINDYMKNSIPATGRRFTKKH